MAHWKWFVGIPLILAMVIPIVGWQIEARRVQHHWDARQARNKNLPIPVRTTAAAMEDAADVIGGTCVTQPHRTATLAVMTANSEISHRELTRVLVREGDIVKKGQVLFEFRDTLFRQVLNEATAQRVLATQQLANLEKLKARGSASGIEYETGKYQLESAKFLEEVARSDYEQCVIRSPIDGVMGKVSAPPGVRMPGSVELATVYELNPVIAQMDFPLERLDSLKLGQDVDVTLDSFPNEQLAGRVSWISPNVTAQTRVLHVYVEIDNSDHRLRGGITGYCRLRTNPQPKLVAPRSAVIRRKGQALVFVVDRDNRARMKSIQVGAMIKPGYVHVSEGLSVGEQVVIFGQDDLHDGDLVNPDWETWALRNSDSDGLIPRPKSIGIDGIPRDYAQESQSPAGKPSGRGAAASKPMPPVEESSRIGPPAS